jgi:putative transposase
VLTDGLGVPLGAVIDGANRNDHKLMRQTLQAIPVERPKPTPRRPQHLCLDKGFDYDEPRVLAAEFGFTLHLRTRGEEVRAKRHARAKARRWVVERTHSSPYRDRLLATCHKCGHFPERCTSRAKAFSLALISFA